MEVEKRGSRGGFLQLFDWNVKSKSRKKLFPNKLEPHEGSEQGNGNVDKQIEVDERGRSNVYDCPSSVDGDEGYGTKAPGVVAKLMGLDYLPSSSACDPCSTPISDANSSRDFNYCKTLLNFRKGHNIMDCGHLPDEHEGFSRNSAGSRPQKVHSRSIERFQTEMLPSKTSKSIPITQQKLLSPIKSPAFIPKKNAAYVMEAAAKIIDPGPRVPIKDKMSSFGSSSVPLRIGDLKEKVETAKKASRPERPKKTFSNKRQNGSEGTTTFKDSTASEKCCSGSIKNNGTSISLAIQAKVNVQRGERLASSSSKTSMSQKEHSKFKSNQISKNQPGMQKSVQKKKKSTGVVRQNDQKQNSVSSKHILTSRTSGSSQQDRKHVLLNGSPGPSKSINKVVVISESECKKMTSVKTDCEMEHLSSKAKNLSQKKQSGSQDLQFEESVGDTVLCDEGDTSMQHNVAIDGSMKHGVDNSKKGMDVVSFTFTSPIKSSMPRLRSSAQVMEKNNCFFADTFDGNDLPGLSSKGSTLGLNVICGDALSVLLEQKLRELTCKVESSQCDKIQTETSNTPSSSQDLMSSFNVVSTNPMEPERFQGSLYKKKSDRLLDSHCSPIDGTVLNTDQNWQGLEGVDEEHCSSKDNDDTEIELDYQLHAAISILEPSSLSISCNSSDSRNSENDSNSEHLSSTLSPEAISWISTRKSEPTEGDMELSDTASSTSTWDAGRSYTIKTFCVADTKISANWELEYVRDIIGTAELFYEEFTLGQANKLLKPSLFNQLENQEGASEGSREECYKLGRKVLFDCVRECLDLRCQQLSRGCKSWTEWTALFRAKGWLAEELFKEIQSWKSMNDLMVDGLVDKDMSSRHGRWVDFQIDAFEEGVKIEKGILSCLIDELVADLFLF